MDQHYAENLRARTQAIFDRDPELKLPDRLPGWDEPYYSGVVAETLVERD